MDNSQVRLLLHFFLFSCGLTFSSNHPQKFGSFGAGIFDLCLKRDLLQFGHFNSLKFLGRSNLILKGHSCILGCIGNSLLQQSILIFEIGRFLISEFHHLMKHHSNNYIDPHNFIS
jgi:hypothetical protein